MENELWTGQRHKLTPCHHHQCRLRELECRGRESPEQTLRPSVPLQDARVAMRSDQEREHKLTETLAEPGWRKAPEGAERLDRRSDLLNEALAKEVERNFRGREEI